MRGPGLQASSVLTRFNGSDTHLRLRIEQNSYCHQRRSRRPRPTAPGHVPGMAATFLRNGTDLAQFTDVLGMSASMRSLTLVVTERCNLRCTYCQVEKHSARRMSPDVIDAAIAWFGQNAVQEPVLSFYGGEPFLEQALMDRAVRGAKSAMRGRSLRVNTPTNTLLLDEHALDFVRREQLELTVSIDGTTSEDRRDPSGKDVTEALLRRMPAVLALQPDCQLLARMTVTPNNVSNLATHVRNLHALGFSRIVYQPAYEAGWTEPAIDVYAREHRRIGTWLIGVQSLGKPLPEIQPWHSIAHRLRTGAQRVHCGAGVDSFAVAPDGGVYPCYRFATERGGERYRLGDLGHGVTALAGEFAALDPARLRPENGACADCPARDGCGHFCPASGALLGEGLDSVASVVCALIRAQVAAMRPYIVGHRRPRTPSWVSPIAVLAAVSVVGCGETSEQPPSRNAANPVLVQPYTPNRSSAVDSGTSLHDNCDDPDASSNSPECHHTGGGVCA